LTSGNNTNCTTPVTNSGHTAPAAVQEQESHQQARGNAPAPIYWSNSYQAGKRHHQPLPKQKSMMSLDRYPAESYPR
jgi:hypothetical protein